MSHKLSKTGNIPAASKLGTRSTRLHKSGSDSNTILIAFGNRRKSTTPILAFLSVDCELAICSSSQPESTLQAQFSVKMAEAHVLVRNGSDSSSGASSSSWSGASGSVSGVTTNSVNTVHRNYRRVRYYPSEGWRELIQTWVASRITSMYIGSKLFEVRDRSLGQTSLLQLASYWGHEKEPEVLELLTTIFGAKFKRAPTVYYELIATTPPRYLLVDRADALLEWTTNTTELVPVEIKCPYSGLLPKQVEPAWFMQCAAHAIAYKTSEVLLVVWSPAGMVTWQLKYPASVLDEVVQTLRAKQNPEALFDTYTAAYNIFYYCHLPISHYRNCEYTAGKWYWQQEQWGLKACANVIFRQVHERMYNV